MRTGTDSELLLRVIGADKFISSVGLIGGSKDAPLDIGEGCGLQEDNVTVEFTTPPTADVEKFIESIHYNLDTIKQRAGELGLEFVITPSAVYDDDQLQTSGAKTFGCEPDFNAWKNGKANPRPRAKNKNLRSAGGHIHLELTDEQKPKLLQYVQALDLFIGAPMLLIDEDTQRRQLYGKAGAFRPKPYGLEYRTPSNAWLRTDPLIRWMWQQRQLAIDFIDRGNDLAEYATKIQDCINNSDLTLLNELMVTFDIHDPR